MSATLNGLDTLLVEIPSERRYTRASGSFASGPISGSSAPEASQGSCAVSNSNVELQHSLRALFNATQLIYDGLAGGPRTTHQEVAAFLHFASHPESGQMDCAEALGISQQTISRWLTEWSTLRNGHGLVTIERDPDLLRKVVIQWTPKGIRLLEAIRAALKGQKA